VPPAPSESIEGSALERLYENPATTISSGVGRADRQAAMLAALAVKAPHPLLVVDVGCGDGMCTSLADQACGRAGSPVRILGFDWSAMALREAGMRGVTTARASTDRLPLRDASVNVVIMSELIEHLVDPDSALDEASRVLVPGGTLLLSTPNLAAWYNRVLLAVGIQPLFSEVSLRGIYGRPGSEVVGHLRLFTRRALKEMLEAAGFVDVRIAGAPYHDVPRPFRPLDRLFCHTPGLASSLLASARRRA
jgi:ubiquinone/menaquinone biosynthesis C-methylase UbiE